jgi:hypothetical protein
MNDERVIRKVENQNGAATPSRRAGPRLPLAGASAIFMSTRELLGTGSSAVGPLPRGPVCTRGPHAVRQLGGGLRGTPGLGRPCPPRARPQRIRRDVAREQWASGSFILFPEKGKII